MAKYVVSLEDGRSIDVYADTEAGALAHAKQEESSRVSSFRNGPAKGARKEPVFAAPTAATKVKD